MMIQKIIYIDSQKVGNWDDCYTIRVPQNSNGQGLLPSDYTAGQISRRLYGLPWNTQKLQYYLKIDVTGLQVIKNAPHNFVILNNAPLNIHNRIVDSGISKFKLKP